MKVIVVGINHAGTSVVRTLIAQNPNIEVTAYDRNSNISFLGCGIALTVSGIVKNVKDLFYCNRPALENMGAKVFMEHEIVAIDTDAKKVKVRNIADGKEFEDNYDKLVYAAGSWPIDIPGLSEEKSSLKNVMVCKLFQHAEELIRKADEPGIESVTVIGAGYIGLELAEAYHIKGKKVTIIDFQNRVIPNYFDTEFTNRLEDDIRKSGITLALGEKVKDLRGENGKVTAVITDKGEYQSDLVIKAIGFRANTDLLPNAEKLRNGALLVNSHMETSIKDVYAVGDCVAMYHAALRKPMQVALATNAVKTGLAAASAINGVAGVEVKSVVGTNAICIFGNNLSSTGLSEEAAKAAGLDVASSYVEDADRPEFMNEYGMTKIKLVYEKSNLRLVGAQIGSYGEVNHTEVIFYLALAIQKELALPDIAFTDVYFLPHYNKPFNFILMAILKALGLNYEAIGHKG